MASTLKSIALSKSGIAKTPNYEISQGVSKAVLKFPHKAVIRTRKYGSSFINLPFPRNARLESSIDWHHAVNLDNLVASIPFLLAKWKR
jgi:hypothetical protein